MLEVMKAKKIMDETTNRYEYNRVRKRYLEGREIYCSYCRYHRGENRDHNLYGKFSTKNPMKYPNWKLVSKNKNQWDEKPLIFKSTVRFDREYVEILF